MAGIKYKETGIDWMPYIPEHWAIMKLKFCDDIIMGQSPESESYNDTGKGVPFLQGNAEFGELNPVEKLYTTEQTKIAPKDSILYSVRAPIGAVNIANKDYCIGRGLAAIYPRKNLQKYLYYLAHLFKQELNGLGTGSTFTAISVSDLANIKIPVPPISEQYQIVSYLDSQLLKISQFIHKKQCLVELLKEQKQSIANQAISRGIKDNTKMKQSNIDILSTIPFHWQLVRIKHLFQEISERSEDGKGSLLMASQEFGLVERAKYHAKAEVAQSTIGHKIVIKGDLVFNKLKAHLGVFFESNYDGLVSPDYAVYRPNDGVNTKYYEFLFRHPAFIKQFIINSTGIVDGLTRLYTSEFFSIKVPFPPKEEAFEIVNFINNETQRINSAITKAEKEIELIKEYKEAMIAEAVMGIITSEKTTRE